MFFAAIAAIIVTMILAMVRTVKGPTVYDRILAVNMAGTKTVLLIAVLGFATGRPDFLDLALIYVFLNFVGMFAILKFVEYDNLATTGEAVEKAQAEQWN